MAAMTEETVSLESIQPKPQELVLAQYMEQVKYWGSPDQWNRWLVRLDCGCITEALIREGHDNPTEQRYNHHLGPDEGPVYKRTSIGSPRKSVGWCILGDTIDWKESRKINPFPDGCCKPFGTIWCSAHDVKHPWRKVEKYIARKSYYNREAGELRYYWTVMLSCGHCYSPNGADEEWSPGMPPVIDQAKIAGIERAIKAGRIDEPEHIRWHRDQIEHNGFMVCTPAMEQECNSCANLRQITDYRLIGKLSDKPWHPPKQEPKRQPTAEEVKAEKLAELQKVEASLKRMQAKAERLRSETQ